MLKRLILFVLATMCVSTTLLAQDAAPDPKASAAQAITLLTPVIVPILVYFAKKAISNIPSALLPILATGLGIAVSQVGAMMTGGKYGLIGGALLGLGGVGLREILDQAKKAVVGPSE